MSREPAVVELNPPPDPFEALRQFADVGPVLLESASRRPRLGRYSFLTADGFALYEDRHPRFGVDPLSRLAAEIKPFTAATIPDLPPFQGGVIGLLGYELGSVWERLPPPKRDDFDIPAFRAELFDWVLAWDHERGRAWAVAHDLQRVRAREKASSPVQRVKWVKDRLAGPDRSAFVPGGCHEGSFGASWCPVPGHAGLMSTFRREDYVNAVARVVEYIRAGDVFQANLSHQLFARTDRSPIELYGRLRAVNPAPFAAYYAADGWAVVSASPERFLQVAGGIVETRPIKGTRPRSADPAEEDHLMRELVESEKDRAENVMIVDLLRNDLSRVCRPGSVTVPELCSLETYETVHHLVSAVRGELEPGRTPWDLFAAAFPGGSITGAPKVRAMEIIHELEPTPRGPYCGSLFYMGFDGSADSSILIRTMTYQNGQVRIGVGGGITAASDAEAEYEETLDKATGMLRALDYL